jgi:hypothetical protein
MLTMHNSELLNNLYQQLGGENNCEIKTVFLLRLYLLRQKKELLRKSLIFYFPFLFFSPPHIFGSIIFCGLITKSGSQLSAETIHTGFIILEI